MNQKLKISLNENEIGFTVVEVIIAASIMTILCVGTLSVYSYVIKINMGNNLRSQALSVLQEEAEFYRAQKFVVDCNSTSAELKGKGNPPYTRPQRTSRDGTVFNIEVEIDNYPFGEGVFNNDECTTTLKQIKIKAFMVNPQPGWLANLRTDLTILRVRAN